MEQFDNFLQITGLFLIVLSAILYTKSYIFNKKNVTLLFITLYLTVCAIVMIISSVLGYNGEANLHYSHIYFISQFIFLSLFYRTVFIPSQKRVVIIVLFLIITILSIQYISKPSLINQFNLFEIFITSVPVIIYSIIHLYNSLSKKGEYMFLNSGILVYITTSTLIFILGDYLSDNYGAMTTKIWMINEVLYVIYLVLILAEWKKTFLPLKSKS